MRISRRRRSLERQPRVDLKILLLPAVTLVCMLLLVRNLTRLQPDEREARHREALVTPPPLDRPAFDRCLRKYFVQKGIPFSVESDTVHVDAVELRKRGIPTATDVVSWDFALAELIRTCCQEAAERWPAMIRGHFEEALDTVGMAADLESILLPRMSIMVTSLARAMVLPVPISTPGSSTIITGRRPWRGPT